MPVPNSSSLSALQQLYEKTQILKHQWTTGQVTLIDQNIGEIFEELRKSVEPQELETGVAVMENGTLFLGEKIHEINQFIAHLIEREKILEVLKDASDSQLNSLLMQCWTQNITIPHLSVNFLLQSYTHLVSHKSLRKKVILPSISDLPIEHSEIGMESGEPFEVQMNAYFAQIQPKLPCNLPRLFQNATNPTQYYELFSFFLHLLHKGLIYYNKNTKLVQLSPSSSTEKSPSIGDPSNE